MLEWIKKKFSKKENDSEEEKISGQSSRENDGDLKESADEEIVTPADSDEEIAAAEGVTEEDSAFNNTEEEAPVDEEIVTPVDSDEEIAAVEGVTEEDSAFNNTEEEAPVDEEIVTPVDSDEEIAAATGVTEEDSAFNNTEEEAPVDEEIVTPADSDEEIAAAEGVTEEDSAFNNTEEEAPVDEEIVTPADSDEEIAAAEGVTEEDSAFNNTEEKAPIDEETVTPADSDEEIAAATGVTEEDSTFSNTEEKAPVDEEIATPVDSDEEIAAAEGVREDDSAFSNTEEKAPIGEEVVNSTDEKKEKRGWFQRLKSGLEKTRQDMNFKINDILGNYVKIDDDMIEDLEDLLISSDIGMQTTMELIDNLKESIRERQIQDPKDVKPLLAEEIQKILEKHGDDTALNIDPSPAVILIVGVNGVGKTTTIGKLAYRFKQEGKSVLIAAADTFRAAAIEQVETWGERSDTPVISHKEGADPAAVVYDALQAQKSRKIDVLICDTAGRLHNKKNLMNELEKIHRIIEKESPDAQKEALLVLDATTGQNAILQAKAFNEVTQLSGIVLTKLDGTAKGGVVLPLVEELDIPIKLIGVGEGMEDLQIFSGKEFSDALVGTE